MSRRSVTTEPANLPAMLFDAAMLIEQHAPQGSEPRRIVAELRRLARAAIASQRIERDETFKSRTPAPD